MFDTSQNYLFRIDEADDVTTYIGRAVRGNSTSDPSWAIQRILESGGETIITYPNGSDDFDFVWDDRASYEYT